ncbi:hypothetical protein G6038_04850 [Rhodococcus sp. 14C212]|uniref:hypothetical protein n=1 Tax=Rhodococcus sp. 14C212 TaxID=2711209 RepID=UPI0013ECA4A7|nr:hypothetical protein [Rhodococcus sp. 14C212]NGP04823.1 hypothetical protein [Rhodococcus sp. 14C212]
MGQLPQRFDRQLHRYRGPRAERSPRRRPKGPELDDRIAAYEIAQERIVELTPVVWYIRTAPAAVIGNGVQGVQMYGMGSIRPELLWTTDSSN